MTPRSPLRLRSLLAALLLAMALPAAAHGLNLVAHAEGESVSGLAEYSDRSPAAGLFIEVRDADGGAVLAEGSSGADGRFRLTVPVRPAYRVAVEGEEGHRAEVTATRLAASTAANSAASGEALRLLREDIARLEHRIRLQDILGGIGYILGLAGLAAWFMARRRP